MLANTFFYKTLCAAFRLKEWKQLLINITAFTVGHSLTLILCALDFVPPNSTVVEAMIPFTIMIVVLANVIDYKNAATLFDAQKNTVRHLFLGLSIGWPLQVGSNL